jgi:environmental stress-induced protein Ves
MRVIPAHSYRRMRWKNGGGETIEIAIEPERASLDAFDWRVSMARVASSGPFSIFPQVDRTLAILEGAEMILRLPGEAEVPLGQGSQPYAFPADIPVDATLTNGEITDLNVMTRRGRLRHCMRRMQIAGPMSLSVGADKVFILAHQTAIQVRADGTLAHLAASDSVIVDGSETAIEVAPALAAATIFVVEFWNQ